MIVGSTTSSVAVSVKRVVSCFILTTTSDTTASTEHWTRENLRIAVFRRKNTMPTFPSHWAGISGSMEEGEEPWETAVRELQEETNLVPTVKPGEYPEAAEETSNKSDNDSGGGPSCEFVKAGGLYLDVPFKPHRNIRVYPFVVRLPYESKANELLELRGTEHDTYEFISVQELEALHPVVPGLAQAFHHATYGQYLARDALPEDVWKWSEDKVNGAATLAKQVIELLAVKHSTTTVDLTTVAMLRPTMVPIVNALLALEERKSKTSEDELDEENEEQQGDSAATCSSTATSNAEEGQLKQQQSARRQSAAGQAIFQSLNQEIERSIQLGAYSLQEMLEEFVVTRKSSNNDDKSPFTIATFSRSSTILNVLKRFLQQPSSSSQEQQEQQSTNIQILCAKSMPGAEGELMAQDLLVVTQKDGPEVTVKCIEDHVLHDLIRTAKNNVQVILVGSDCLMDQQVVNKIGTKAIAEMVAAAKTVNNNSDSNKNQQQATSTRLVCIADRWKLWDDIFAPPLEDIFECVPRDLFDSVLVPP